MGDIPKNVTEPCRVKASRGSGFSVGRFATWVAAMILVGVAFSLPSQAAANETFRISFDENKIALGPVGNLPIGQITSGSSIEGTVDSDGNVSIPKAKFTLPVLGIDEPVKVRGYMGIEEDATGTWDPKTGRLEIQAKAGLWLSVDVAATIEALEGAGISLGNLGFLANIIGSIGDLTCGFSPMNVTFTTETTSLGTGQRFTKGLNGPGALTAEWSELGPFAGKTRVLFLDVCTTLQSFAPTLITSLAGNAIPGLDLGGIDIAGLLQNLDNVDLGPSSLTITRTIDESKPAELALALGRQAVTARAGRPTRIAVRVTNSGESPASGVVICPRISGPLGIKARCLQVGAVPPGTTVTRQMTMIPKQAPRSRSTKKRGPSTRQVRLTFVASAPGLPERTRSVVLKIRG